MPYITLENLHEASQFINQRLELDKKPRAHTAIVLGSGLGPFAEKIKSSPHAAAVPFSDVPHFSTSTVEGHKGEIVYGLLDDGHPVLALNGRLHLYEGLHPQQIVLPTRVAGLLGIKTLVITNAAGAIGDDFEPGQLMVIADHLNFTGDSPLVGKNFGQMGPRFLDMSDAYDKELRIIAKKAAAKADIKMHEGIYAGMLGPCYETPAEIRMLKLMGAHAVGMSTIYETIIARHMGIKVLAISCLTNKAAGLSSQKISHDEVMDNNAKVSAKLAIILADVVGQIG
jgi:purine-nucleoside phosphorylase